MVGLNFNRYIHITLYGEKGIFVLKTPKTGRKPNIEVHGLLMASDYARDVEIRITGLYGVNLTLFSRITVNCGYVGKPGLVFDGTISFVYTEQPGPERVTVIKCLLADAEKLINATCTINLEAGMRLDSVLQTLTIAINKAKIPQGNNAAPAQWANPQIDQTIKGLMSNAPLSWNGPIKDLMPDLKNRFPGAVIVVQNNQFRAIDIDNPPAFSGKTVALRFLQSPPSYTAGRVVVTAPWEPGLSPGDQIYFPNSEFGVKDITAGTPSARWIVLSVQFDFSTVGNQNKMVVTGVNG